MENSKSFKYVKNQFILGNFTEEELLILVSRNIISENERIELLNLNK